jgi:hypothetical protein
MYRSLHRSERRKAFDQELDPKDVTIATQHQLKT